VAMGKMDHEMKAFEKEIRTKSVPQLYEVLARQNKILENKSLLLKLPDKGAKVKHRKVMIEVKQKKTIVLKKHHCIKKQTELN
jgi:hypothetical protein